MAAVLVAGRVSDAQTARTLVRAGGPSITYEESGPQSARNCLILLHGASGPSILLYRQQAAYFAGQGFHVLMPHYFDATHSSSPTTANYEAWVGVVEDLAAQCRQEKTAQKVLVIGYSLGASVALAAGSQGAKVDAIAEWYGSLPDEFFNRLQGMPPLLILHGERDTNIPIINGQQLVRLCELKELHCEHHFYADQGHGFSGKALDDADQRTLSFFSSLQ